MNLFVAVVAVALQALVGVAQAGTGFDWPLAAPHTVVRPFQAPPHAWSAGHRGVDLLGTAGQPVLAAGPGVVTFSGVIAGRGTVTVRHADGRRTTYEPLDVRAPAGRAVATGEPIGVLGSAGSHCAPRACLHWGLLVGPDDYRDPLSLLQVRQTVLLPP